MIELSSYNRSHMSYKAESIYNEDFMEKSLPTHGLEWVKNDLRN